jgi:uncharacterized membrane protein
MLIESVAALAVSMTSPTAGPASAWEARQAFRHVLQESPDRQVLCRNAARAAQRLSRPLARYAGIRRGTALRIIRIELIKGC